MNKIRLFIVFLSVLLYACNSDNEEVQPELKEFNVSFEFTYDAPMKFYYYDIETRVFVPPYTKRIINRISDNWQTGMLSKPDTVRFEYDKLEEGYKYIIILYARESKDIEEKAKERFYVSDTLIIKKDMPKIKIKYPDDIPVLLKPYTPPPTP